MGSSLLMLSLFRSSRIYFHKLLNNRRQLSSFSSIFSIQRNVNHEVTRKLSSSRKFSTCKPLSIDHYSVNSKKLFNSANLTLPIYTLQSFSSSSQSGKFDESDRKARTVFVGNLSKDTIEDSIRKYFSEKNYEVTDCKILRDKVTGTSRQFGFVEFATVEQAKLAFKKRHLIDSKEVSVKMSGTKELDDKYRIFVGGLLKETLQPTLHRYFSQFGDIFACNIVRNDDNFSKGFGYVTYTSQESVERVLTSRPHCIIDNKVVDVKHTLPRRRELTLIIGNLSPKTNDESLRRHFLKYGQLMEFEVKIDRQTGLSRRFGYVAFESHDELNRALNEKHVIDGVEVEINHKTNELDLQVDSLPRNISEKSSEKSLCDYFSRYGRVRDCRFIKNSVGTTTAFVAMSGKDEISRALNARPHWIDGKLVLTRYQGAEFALIVHGIPQDATDEDLYETFSKAGKLVHWDAKRGRKTDRSLDFGFVSFSSAEDVALAIENQPYFINGTKLKIERRYDISKHER